MAITITDEDLNYIYTVFGFPYVTLDDIDILSEQAIKDYVIQPTLEEYYRWFPLKETQQIAVSSGATEGSVDFPDSETFGVYTCKFALKQDTDVYSSTGVTDPFFSTKYIRKVSGGHNLGSRMDYGFSTISKSTAWGIDSQAQANQVLRWDIDHKNRKVNYFSQQPGFIEIVWAKYSDDVSDVMFRYKRQFLDLCKGYLKLYMAEFLTKIDPAFPSNFDSDNLKEEGQELVDKIMEKWQNKTKSTGLTRG